MRGIRQVVVRRGRDLPQGFRNTFVTLCQLRRNRRGEDPGQVRLSRIEIVPAKVYAMSFRQFLRGVACWS